MAKRALELAAAKLPIKCKFIVRERPAINVISESIEMKAEDIRDWDDVEISGADRRS